MFKFSIQQIFSEFRTSFRLALPLIASEIIYGLSGFISNIMVAHLGREELAANALVWGVFLTVIVLFIGILSSTGVLVAQSFGAKDKDGIASAAKQGLILSVIFAIPMVIFMLISPKILILTGQEPEIVRIATSYFHALIWAMLPLNVLIVLEQFLLGIAQTRLVLLISILTVPIQMVFFYLFMFGKFGFPKLGLAGIGYGMAAANYITAIIIILYVKYAKVSKDYQIFVHFWKINRKFFLEIIRVGFPIGAMFAVELALFTTMAFMIGRFGKDSLAAHQIAFQCFGFALTVVFALSQTTSIRVGHEVGRNDKSGVKLAAYVNMVIGFLWMLILALLYIAFPKKIISLDLNILDLKYQNVVHYAIEFLFVAAILQLTECYRFLSVSALRGLKDTKIPMFISIVGFWLIAFTAAYLLGFIFDFKGVGVWWGVEIGLAICAAILFVRFHYLLKKLDLSMLITRS